MLWCDVKERATRALRWAILPVVVVMLLPTGLHAQERVFVQIESHSTLSAAETRARVFTREIGPVNGFQAVTGLYALALGPYTIDDASDILQDLRGRGLIPSDSFIEDGDLYARQVFPVGGRALQIAAGNLPLQTSELLNPEEPVDVVALTLDDETPQQARNSERQLSRPEREEIQIALEWFGFYNAGIDGAFGPGTRRGMTAFQANRGFEETGVLTTRQRALLLQDYQAEVDALGMRAVIDIPAGIEITLPGAMVSFDGYNFPFARYTERDGSGVDIYLISQPGDRNTLLSLYEVLQTLEIVPINGPRSRSRDGFEIEGRSDTLRAVAEAELDDGAIKGFLAVWTPERDEQMERVLPMMRSSFEALSGALDPSAVPEEEDAGTRISGLTLRQPDMVRSGFYADGAGTVLTSADLQSECTEILINGVYPAEVTLRDAALGVTVLRPLQALAPTRFAEIAPRPARLRSDVAVASFPFEGTLPAASMQFGALDANAGFDGSETRARLAMASTPSEAGAPVFGPTGAVIGLVLPRDAAGRTLPADVTLALRLDGLAAQLADAGLEITPAADGPALNPTNLALLGSEITVTVSCWN